jgi:two-component system sensor histidine kinase/response regulator
MNDLDKSKEELIKELKKLQQKYDSLKEISDKDITERKCAEEELKKSQLLLSSTINSQKDTIIFSIDNNYNYLSYNKAHADVMKYAYNKDIKAGMNILDCITSDEDRIEAKNNYDCALSGESHRNIRVFGDVNHDYYESFFNPILDDKNKIIGCTGLARNINERKQAEEALLQRENYLSALNKVKGVLISSESENPLQQFVDILGKVSNASRTYIFINHKNEANELLMSQKAEYCAEGIKPEIDNPALQNLKYNEFYERWYKTLQIGELILGRIVDFPVAEKELLTAQDIKTILVVPIMTEKEFIGFIGFDNCVSDKEWEEAEKNFLQTVAVNLAQFIERKRTNEQLQEESTRFQTVMDTIDSSVYVADMQTHELLFTNHEFNNLFGEHIGEKCYSVIQKGQTKPCDFCTNHLLLDTKGNPKEPHIWEFQNTITKQWYLLSDRAIKWTDNRIVRIEIATDITKQKQAEEALKKSESRLSELNATKDKFFNIIAHDLKSPFNSIVGFSNLLIEQVRGKNYEGIGRYAGIIEQSSNRAMDLLMNLMEWARSQTGRMEFNPEYFEMVSVITETALLFDDIATQKTISIVSNLPANAPVFADKAMISTVLRNLISNTIKFTHSGGRIIISAYKTQNQVKVSVSDNGVGISEANIQKLFSIDENHSTSGTNKEKGTGLGLILCKEFIEKNEGNIWVESEEGNGSTFYFTLPKEAETTGKNEN